MEDDFFKKFMDRPMYYGRKGEPLSLEQFVQYAEDMDYRRVGYDEIPATHRSPTSYLSTVWLGLDHSFFLRGPPVIFETMRFEQKLTPSKNPLLFPAHHESIEFPHPDDGEYTDQVRYCTEEQASIGHKTIMRMIQEMEMT